MSSPLSNLKKGKKAPLPCSMRSPPYKPTVMTEEELISQLNVETKEEARKFYQKKECTSQTSLMSTMISRLSNVENKLVEYEKIMKEKDKQIRILEDKCAIYKRAQGYGSNQVAELEKKCHKLQNQVHSMESFLEDYGMIWVGNPNSSDEEELEDEDDCNDLNGEALTLTGGGKMWNPDISVSGRANFQMDFDLVLKNVKELNLIAGEGEHFIKHTKDGARLQMKEPVPLTLYSNGIFMFGGPFRSFEDPVTQNCLQDLMDGYFPSELQALYPEGVPFKVSDKRHTLFKDKRLQNRFPGEGQMLSPEKCDPTLICGINVDEERAECADHIVQRQSVDRFLSKLPLSVIKGGKVIDIRGGLSETLKDTTSKNEVIVIETDTVKEMKTRLNSARKSRPSTASAVTTLRIKSESGDQTYMLKMKYTDTIEDVRKHLNEIRNDYCPTYDLKTSFPNQTYTDVKRSLKDYSLIPNATMYIVKKVVTS